MATLKKTPDKGGKLLVKSCWLKKPALPPKPPRKRCCVKELSKEPLFRVSWLIVRKKTRQNRSYILSRVILPVVRPSREETENIKRYYHYAVKFSIPKRLILT